MEIFIIFITSVIAGLLLFIALTINSISHDLFSIKRFLKKREEEL